MWQVENLTPFAAERGWIRDRNGAEIWLVALKCTFDILPDGSTHVAKEQPPVLRTAEYHGEPGKSSIKYESDLILTKTTTDIVVLGHAHAPRATPVVQLDVGFRVGTVKKMLRVFGDRKWTVLGPSEPLPFVKMPIVYERAFGGVDPLSRNPDRDWEWRNPVGMGFAVSPDNLSGRAVPNIEYLDDQLGSWSDRPRPAGFGPIASHWQLRASLAGTYDDKWMKERLPLPPDDFQDRFFQVAPPDQQTPEFLQGGEDAELFGLTPEGHLRFQLPRIFPGFETEFGDGTRQHHTDRNLHTVILEPDFPRVSLVWHSALPCHFKPHKLRSTTILIKENVGAATSDAEDDEDQEFA